MKYSYNITCGTVKIVHKNNNVINNYLNKYYTKQLLLLHIPHPNLNIYIFQ